MPEPTPAPSLEGKLTVLVISQVNICLMPAGDDPTTIEEMNKLDDIAQRTATWAKKPVRLLFHDRDILTKEFKP
jgi:hypothetical protein